MKSYLVDVATQINIWVRPELQKKQLDVLRKARPSILIIISDGGRNDEEWALIRSNRKMVENGIDWDCTVHKLYKDENIGVKKMIMQTHQFIWDRVDKCIFLEDDIIPSISFFRYCKELLDRYENDNRISVICGMNHLGVSENVTSDYFFSRQGSIWGFALWKRSYEQYYRFAYEDSSYYWNLFKKNSKKDQFIWKLANRIKNDKDIDYSPTEFFMEMSVFTQNQLMIIPQKNLICCEGASRSAHGADSIDRLPRGIRRVFFMKTYELDFPMKHPEFMMADVEYEKKRNRIIARNNPMVRTYRRFERGIYILLNGDIKYLWKKLIK